MDHKHNEVVLTDYLDYLAYKKIITKYYLRRTRAESWELQINHNVISERNVMCILFEVNLFYFSLEEVKRIIKDFMTKNFAEHLKRNM